MAAATKEPNPKTVTASELAEQLGVEPSDFRKWLRAESKNVGRGKRYEFTPKQATALKKKFRAAQKAERDGGDES